MRRLPVLVVVLMLAACARSSSSSGVIPSSEVEPSSCPMPARAPVGSEARQPSNVDGAPLATCSTSPMTGVYRDGRCATGPSDVGVHVVCAQVTEPFLRFTASRGNDLSTPAGSFPGLKPGDRWCLCASRWGEAEEAGLAPPVVIEATEIAALRTLDRKKLDAHAKR